MSKMNARLASLKKKKESILKSNGYSQSDLEPQYNCMQCNDTGYITSNYSSPMMCNCLKQKLLEQSFEVSNLKALKNDTFDNFNFNYFSDIQNPEKYNSKLSPRQNIELIHKASLNFIDNFSTSNNLLFTGNTGLGKTFLSSCIANKLISKGKTVLYQSAPILIDSIIEDKLNKSSKTNIQKLASNVDLLIIDDLGTELVNQMTISEFLNLLNIRLLGNSSKAIKTIISTNLNLKELFNIYGERFSSRIIGNFDIYNFFGDDIRLKKKFNK